MNSPTNNCTVATYIQSSKLLMYTQLPQGIDTNVTVAELKKHKFLDTHTRLLQNPAFRHAEIFERVPLV